MPKTIATLEDAIAHAGAYLKAIESRRLEEIRAYLAPQVQLVFPGGRVMTDAEAMVSRSAGRYRHVSKTIGSWEGFASAPKLWTVYCRGTLQGEWSDGTPFSGIRYVDRFEVGPDGIRAQEVWNDTGEARLRLRPEPGPAPASGRGAEKIFFGDPRLDRLMGMLWSLAAETWVLRDRLGALEAVLADAGTIARDALDAYRPSAEQKAALERDREAFTAHVLGGFSGRPGARP